jgi:hypothetical protein
MRARYVLMMAPSLVMLRHWVWVDLVTLARLPADQRPGDVWTFRSIADADRARRAYGRGRWRDMEVVPCRSALRTRRRGRCSYR